MTHPFLRSFVTTGLMASVSVLAIGAHAAAAQSTQGTTVGEVVVTSTGTLIRGKAPTGAEMTTVTGADLVQLGVVDTSQILGALPQDAEFNSRPQVGSFGAFQTVNAPLLRYLGGNSSGSNSTLLLLDGVRLPGMGVQQTSADIDAIAPGALARVDVVPDGGSATYGADAVGGVVNLITRKHFDGVEVGGHYGGAANYGQGDVDFTAGKTWNKASVWVSYDYSEHNLILNNQRSYEHNLNYSTTPYTPVNQTCNPGNFTVGRNVFPIVNGVPGTGAPNTCDNSKSATFFPAETRHSAMVGFDYDIASWLTFDLRGYYMHRDATNDGGVNAYSNVSTVAPEPIGLASGLFTQAPFQHAYGYTTTETWGVIPRLTAKLGHDWQLDAYFNVAEGDATAHSQTSGGDSTQLGLQAKSGAFDPLTGAFASSTAGQQAEAYQANYDAFSSGKDQIVNSRAVLDGPLFSLPGGEVRAAIGGEYMHESFSQRNGNAEIGDFGTILPHSVSRVVTSGFGELLVPIVGENNHIPLVDSLTFSAQGRYDNYSDFGGTFDPKLSLAWKPVDWWTIRGNWGRSFQAPSLASTASAIPPGVVSYPAGLFATNPAFPNTKGLTTILLFPGGGVDLQPQKAITWEIGTDIRPPMIPGLSLGMTYYNIDFSNRIGTSEFYFPSFYKLYPSSYIMNTPANPLTSAQIAKFVDVAAGNAQVQKYVNNPSLVYDLESALNENLSSVKTSGLDFNANYTRPTDFGSAFAGVSGTYILNFDSRNTPTSTPLNLDDQSISRWRLQTTVGARWNEVLGGSFLAKATWNMTGGYRVAPVAGDAYQSNVSAFNVINLAFVYTPNAADGVWKGTQFGLNIDNLFDADPPYYNGGNGNAAGYAGFTLGRFIQFGAKKKF